MNFVLDSMQYSPNENGQSVFRDPDTIGYLFINEGNCNVAINNYVLKPNSTLKTFEVGMIDTTKWVIQFNTFDACSITNGLLVVLIYSKR